MVIQKEVKVIISAVDEYSGGMLGFSNAAWGVIAAVEAIAAAMVVASIKAAEFAIDLGDKVWTSATDFHDAMYNVEAVAQSFGTTGEQISSILDDLTQKFPITGKQAGDSMQLIAQLGYGTEKQLRDMADAANTLQIATGADLQTGIMGTLSALNSFNLESGEASRIINLLAAASFSSAANIEDLGIAMRYAAPIASLMGVSVEETVAAIALLRDRGLEASQTGTTLRMALIQLGKETEKKTQVLAKYGLTMADVNPEVVGLTGVIEAFKNQVISGSDAAVLFGVRSVAFANIINMGADAFDTYRKSITGTNAAYDAMEKKMATWAVVQKQVQGNIDLFQKTIAGGLVPDILKLIGTNENEGFRGVINAITQIEKQTGALNEAFVSPIQAFIEAIENSFSSNFNSRVENVYDLMGMLALALSANLETVMVWGETAGEIFLNMFNDMEDLRNWLYIINTAFTLIALPVVAVHDAFALFVNTITGAAMIIEKDFYRITLGVLGLHKWIAELIGLIPGMKESMGETVAGIEVEMEKYRKKIVEVEEKWKNEDYMEFYLDNLVDTVDKAGAIIGKLEPPKPALDTFWDPQTVDDVKVGVEEIVGEFYKLDSSTLAMYDKLGGMPEAIGVSKTAAEEFGVAVKAAVDSFDFSGSMEGDAWGTGNLLEYNDALDGQKAILKDLEPENEKYTLAVKGVGDEAEVVLKKLNALRAPGDLVFDNITGKAIYFKGALTESADAVVNLDKSIEQMTDKEFSLYTEKFKADLALVAQESKQTFDLVKTNIEWKAKLDIEEVKASAEVLKAAFQSVGESVKSTSDATEKLVGTFADLLTSDKWISSSDKSFVQRMAQEQMELQKKAILNQTNLTNAEIELMKAKTEKIKNLNKEAMIKIDGDGLKPHLEAMMWEVFAAIQVRATEEGLDKLLLGGSLSE